MASKYSILTQGDSAMNEVRKKNLDFYCRLHERNCVAWHVLVNSVMGFCQSWTIWLCCFCFWLAVGAFVIVEMLFSSSLLAIVGAGEEVCSLVSFVVSILWSVKSVPSLK